jgi:hypothetical protein
MSIVPSKPKVPFLSNKIIHLLFYFGYMYIISDSRLLQKKMVIKNFVPLIIKATQYA